MSRSARHIAILGTVALCGCLAAIGGWRFAKASAPVNGPIILVSVDSLRADRLKSYGYANGQTPAFDQLAADGLVFDRAYAHVPQTLPAHTAILTGRLPFETGVRDSAGYALPSSVRTLAEVLRDRGFATAGVVSSYILRKETGIGRGFTFFDSELPAPDLGAPDAWLTRDGTDSELVAERWLESVGTSRAFLFLHLSEPHAPRSAPARFESLAPYDAEVAYADEILGKLLRYLKAHQLYDRSTILVVSDHGEGLGDHGEQGHGLLVYEEALRIPWIMKLPASEGAGRRVAVPVQHIDIVPTILDLAKAPRLGGLRGRSLTPLFAGDSVASAPIYAESLYGQYRFGWQPVRSLIVDGLQLIDSGARVQLLDLESRAAPLLDLAAERPEQVARLQQRLEEYASPAAQLEATPVTATDRERFEALGYIGVPGAVVPSADAVDPHDKVAFVEGYRAAVVRSRSADWKATLDEYKVLTREEPEMADLWLHLARSAARHERHDLALDGFRRVLALEPANVAARLGLANTLLRTRKIEDAATEARTVLEGTDAERVQTAEAHEVLARAALARRDEQDAIDHAGAAQAADAGRPVRALVEGRIALDHGRFEEAVDAFERALSASAEIGRPPLADLRVFASEALVRLDRGAEAEELLKNELLAYPANARARSMLQSLYRASGRHREATALARR